MSCLASPILLLACFPSGLLNCHQGAREIALDPGRRQLFALQRYQRDVAVLDEPS